MGPSHPFPRFSPGEVSFRLAVPVGLQFEPRRQFRAEVLIRVGNPFAIEDLAAAYAENPHRAVRELTDRIGEALKAMAFHVEWPEKVALVERLAEIYLERAQRTGFAGVHRRGLRAEILYRTAACLNHYARVDPAIVSEVEGALERYERRGRRLLSTDGCSRSPPICCPCR